MEPQCRCLSLAHRRSHASCRSSRYVDNSSTLPSHHLHPTVHSVNDVVQQPYVVRPRSGTKVADVTDLKSHAVSVIAAGRQLEAIYDDEAGADAVRPGNLESTASEASGGDLARVQLRAAIDHIARRCRCIATARDVGAAWVG